MKAELHWRFFLSWSRNETNKPACLTNETNLHVCYIQNITCGFWEVGNICVNNDIYVDVCQNRLNIEQSRLGNFT